MLLVDEEVGEDPKVPAGESDATDGDDEAVGTPEDHAGELHLQDFEDAANDDGKGSEQKCQEC